MRNDALHRALAAIGGQVALAKAIGISSQAIAQWKHVPPLRVLEVERVTGISRHDLRPDIYGPAVTAGREQAPEAAE